MLLVSYGLFKAAPEVYHLQLCFSLFFLNVLFSVCFINLVAFYTSTSSRFLSVIRETAADVFINVVLVLI